MKLLRGAAVAALLLMSFAASASAAVETYMLDPSHTVVGFSVRHFFSQVPGSFKEFSGTMKLDTANLDASSVDATIQTTSIFTNNDRRDNHLRSADFFEVDKYPTITFKSTKVIPGKSESNFQVVGDLTIRGITKPATLDVEYNGSGPVGIQGNSLGMQAGFTASTTVNRKDYGIVWNRQLDQGGVMLGDDVDITLSVAAVSREPKPATPTSDKSAAATDKK